jgi:hypothetical protein
MQTEKLTAYEHELGRPMSSEERRLFGPAASSSSSIVPPPEGLGEDYELPKPEEEENEEEEEAVQAKKERKKEIRDYIKKKKGDLKRIKYPTLTDKQVDGKTKTCVKKIHQQINAAGDDASMDEVKKIIDDTFKDFFF